MNSHIPARRVANRLVWAVVAFSLTLRGSDAATLWTGTNVTFTETRPELPDVLISNKVSFARYFNGPLYNPAAGELGPDYVTSPADTLWAFGALTNYTNLTFDTFAAIRNGAHANLEAAITNRPMVVHLLAEDVYLALTFTSWTRHWPQVPGTNGFSYVRSTPTPPVATTIRLTSPNLAGGQFSFNYTANTGVSYAVQGSSDLRAWSSGPTNVAASTNVHYSESISSNRWRFYRVLRLPGLSSQSFRTG